MSAEPISSWIRARWNHFWFEPSGPTDLGVSRILAYGILLALFWSRDTSAWASVPHAFWMPIPLFGLLHLPLLSGPVLHVLDVTWKVALGLSCVGAWTRISTLCSCVLGIYLLGLPQNFGKTHHPTTIVVLLLAVMAVSRSGDAWSVDGWINRIRRTRRDLPPRPPPTSPEYTWPLRLIGVLFALVYFGAAISKLRHSGLAWVTSDNLRLLLIAHHYHHLPPTTWGLHLAQYPWLGHLQAAAALTLELSAVLIIFHGTARRILLPSLIAMQSGIWLLMGVPFTPYASALPFLVPWERCGRRLADWFGGRPKVRRLYGGGGTGATRRGSP